LTCLMCRYWEHPTKHPKGFMIGECQREPEAFEVMGVCDMYGVEHERIATGEGFCCINFMDIEDAHE
jgi:hypothetical protein